MNLPKSTLFDPGHVVATDKVLEVLSTEDMFQALDRHLKADWGDLDQDDKRANEHALIQDEGRLVSCYHSVGGVRFYIITEADRSVTTFMLPEEY